MTKQPYRVRNWKKYNRSLVQRGSLTVWIDEKIHEQWYQEANAEPKQGRPACYSDVLIKAILVLKAVYHLPYRATMGLAQSIFQLMGLNLPLPHYSTVCRRAQQLSVDLSKVRSNQPIDLAIDSTGLKIHGEGEWKVRQHGVSKRRTWRKLHLAVNTNNGQIEAMALTTNDLKDHQLIADLIGSIDQPIDKVCADGAYDAHACYQYLQDQGIEALIPPRKDAVIKGDKPENPRDEIVRRIQQQGRKDWKKNSGYHQRSLSETAMFRIKTLFGHQLSARKLASQVTEARVRCQALNRMTALGMPESYRVA